MVSDKRNAYAPESISCAGIILSHKRTTVDLNFAVTTVTAAKIR